jgi:Tfp pilus assembly protein PilX
MSRIPRLGDENGFVLGTAMAVLFIILLLGAAALRTVDAQTHQSGHETAGEAAFNLAESALDAETSQLGTKWPSSTAPWSATCNQSTTPTTGCPGTSLTNAFGSTYAGSQYAGQVSWQLQVFDNNWPSNKDYYDDSMSSAPTYYDGNGDNKLWVRALVTVAGQTRVVVAEVVRQPQVVSLPRNVITAGGMYTSNNGHKVIVNAYDCAASNTCTPGANPPANSGSTGTVALRCQTAQASYGSLCAGWDPTQGQLSPATFDSGYTDATPGYQTLQPGQMSQLKWTAIQNGTYYNGSCPPAGQSGVVYVENPPNGSCYYNANTTWNSDSAPGMLIFANGTVGFDGTLNFYGIIYMADGQGPAPSSLPCQQADLQQDGTVFTVHGNGTLFGALFVGNCGVVNVGSAAFNVQFDSNAFNGAIAYATPALAKNTFQLVSH